MPRFNPPIEYALAAEAAASLAHAGRRLRKALDALSKHDAAVDQCTRRADPKVRAGLLADAGEAFWGYVVQRELLGLLDADYIAAEYAVPLEVQQVMRPKISSRHCT